MKVYKLGRRFTLENPKYHRFFAEDFYAINKSYLWKQTTDDYELSIKYSGDTEISIHVKYLDTDLRIDNVPLIIKAKIDISDLISSKNLSDAQTLRFIDDESAFMDYVSKGIIERATSDFIDQITDGAYNSKFSSKVFTKFNSTTLTIKANIEQELALMREPNINKEDVLFAQLPCAHFIYSVEDGKSVPEIDTYKWFLNFVYFMRNALFHEIIDPLDAFWQEIFKHSYLALKEILDGNINYFIEKEKVLTEIKEQAWDELRSNTEIYIPNYNDEINDNDIEIDITEYHVSPITIELKANVFLDYWFDEHSMKRMHATCDVELMRDDAKINRFIMKFIKLHDLTIGA